MRLFFTLFYFLVWCPVGAVSLLWKDWLRRRSPANTNWQSRPERVNRAETLREPF